MKNTELVRRSRLFSYSTFHLSKQQPEVTRLLLRLSLAITHSVQETQQLIQKRSSIQNEFRLDSFCLVKDFG